jgi:hypothetical protein
MTGVRTDRRLTAVFAVLAAFAIVLVGLVALSPRAHAATTYKVLFDNAHAETAGNADWIISTSQPDPLAQNANPSVETSWTGALSAWGVALQKTGSYSLKTLPSGSALSYGTTAALDLGNFNAVVIDEPNTLFTTAEKTALMNFVKGGGGLFLISDHTVSDRNNDGSDSPAIINDLMTNNSVNSSDPFGFSVDLLNIATGTPKAITDSTNPVLHGSFGTVTGSNFYNGTTFTLKPADNSSVKGLLYRSGYSGNTGAFFVTSTYGTGKVAIWGDSSDVDDGTGQSGNTLYNGWNDPAGTNPALALNATAWLVGASGGGTPTSTSASATATATPTPTATATATGGSCAASQLLGNNGFETGSAAPWTANNSSILYSGSTEPARTGSYDAWLDGYGTTTTDTLAQTVTLPSGCSSYAFGFYLHVNTAETGTSTAYDTLKVQLLNSSGTVLSTLATYSNLSAATGYIQHSFSLAAYAGQTVTVKFTGAEDSTKQTSFVLDDTSLNIG